MHFKKFIELLELLEEKKIPYQLDKIRDGSIMVEIYFQDEIWEVEFVNFDDEILIEKFHNSGEQFSIDDFDSIWAEWEC